MMGLFGGGTVLSGQRTVWGHLFCPIVPTCVLSLPLFPTLAGPPCPPIGPQDDHHRVLPLTSSTSTRQLEWSMPCTEDGVPLPKPIPGCLLLL